MGEAVESYLDWYMRQDRRPKSRLNAEQQTRAILEHLDPDTPLDRIGQEEAEVACRTLGNGTPAAHNTERNRRGRFMSVIKHAHTVERDAARKDDRPVAWSPPDITLKIEMQRARVRYASRHEVLALLGRSSIYQDAYLRSFLHLGLRASELIHTRIGADLDTDRWTWKIQPRKGWHPKTRRSVRELDVPPEPSELRAAIRRYLRLSPASSYVFRNPRTGERWGIGSLARDFEALCGFSNVVYGEKRGGLTLHSLRHTFGTNLVQVADVTYAAAIMGNTVEECSRTYVHPSRKELASAIARSEPYE
jgi:integrase